jgi:hypothetical protein
MKIKSKEINIKYIDTRLWNMRKKKEGIALMSYFRLLHLLEKPKL